MEARDLDGIVQNMHDLNEQGSYANVIRIGEEQIGDSPGDEQLVVDSLEFLRELHKAYLFTGQDLNAASCRLRVQERKDFKPADLEDFVRDQAQARENQEP